ncbi:MAG: hypothetical protein ACYTFY_18055 [Planctomycetota bacterium]|jgi:NADH:ubiquinone oxidoreductase subunit E
MNAAVEKVLDKYKSPGRDSLIPILQDVQDEEGYISKDSSDSSLSANFISRSAAELPAM